MKEVTGGMERREEGWTREPKRRGNLGTEHLAHNVSGRQRLGSCQWRRRLLTCGGESVGACVGCDEKAGGDWDFF